jgi:3-methyl-2-oxobutanoate hydroxymethyltransferase
MIPASLADEISLNLQVPTIGIGAGGKCDGQVLVLYDLLGLNPDFNPKFLKKYLNGCELISEAIKTYSEEVKAGVYPSDKYSFKGTVGKEDLEQRLP